MPDAAPRALTLAFPARLRRVRKRLSLSQNNLGEGRGRFAPAIDAADRVLSDQQTFTQVYSEHVTASHESSACEQPLVAPQQLVSSK